MEAKEVKVNLVEDHTASKGQGWPLNSILLIPKSSPQYTLEAGPRVHFHVQRKVRVLSSEHLTNVLQYFLNSLPLKADC